MSDHPCVLWNLPCPSHQPELARPRRQPVLRMALENNVESSPFFEVIDFCFGSYRVRMFSLRINAIANMGLHFPVRIARVENVCYAFVCLAILLSLHLLNLPSLRLKPDFNCSVAVSMWYCRTANAIPLCFVRMIRDFFKFFLR